MHKYKFQEMVIKFRKLKFVKYFYFLCIGFNIIILALYYHRQPPEMTDLLGKINFLSLKTFIFFTRSTQHGNDIHFHFFFLYSHPLHSLPKKLPAIQKYDNFSDFSFPNLRFFRNRQPGSRSE